MSLPTAKDLQAVDPVLTNILVGFYQQQNRFVAGSVFPSVPVEKDSGTFYKFTQKYWFTDNMDERAYGGDFPFGNYGVETDTYGTLQYALAKSIADEERANSQLALDLETAAVRWLAMKALLRKERAWAADFMKTSVWGTDGSISNKWSDYDSSDPVGDIATGRRTISQKTGYAPNKLVIGEIVRDRLINHPDLIDRIKYTQVATQGSVETALSALFMVDQVLVGMAIYNTANEGQTASYSAIIDDDALLLYTTPTPSIFEASAGYTFVWGPGGGDGTIYAPYRDYGKQSDVIQSKMQWDQKAVATDLGYFMSDCVD